MKAKGLKTVMIAFVAAISFTMAVKSADAQNYLTVYMDSVSDLVTVYGCDTYDSIKFVPCSGNLVYKYWIVCEYEHPFFSDCDTIFPDTLFLPSGFEGMVSFQGHDGMNFVGGWINIKPLSLLGEDKIAKCGSTIQLEVYTNYSGIGSPEYDWTPLTGLNDPGIPNPIATVLSDMEYTVTMNAPNGCIISKNISVTLQPMNSPSICLVSVDSTNKNIIYWDKPVSSPIDSFYIYKETDVTDVYQRIGEAGYNDNNVFLDTASNAQIQSNKYSISAKDSCGYESNRSTPHKTMHLSLNQGLNNVWNLIWEPYIGIPVSTYYIYRGTTSKNLELIGTTSGSNTQFSDLNAPAGEVHYQIEIVSPVECVVPDNGTGLKSTALSINKSRSNMVSFTPTDLGEINTNPDLFSVYPNPAGEMLFIESSQAGISGGRIEICNITGKVIQETTFEQFKAQMNMSDLESGFYLLRIKTKCGTVTKKITKE
jgi:hypothetical protein